MTYCSHNLPFEIRCPDCREEAFLRERQRMLTPPTRQAECGIGGTVERGCTRLQRTDLASNGPLAVRNHHSRFAKTGFNVVVEHTSRIEVAI